MGSWYWIGVCAGLGVAVGVLLAGVLTRTRAALAAALVLAVAAGVAVGFALGQWDEAVGGGVGGALGSIGAAQLVSGTLRRGGSRFGTAIFITLAAVLIAAVAWIPVAGYLEATLVPALAARLRGGAGRGSDALAPRHDHQHEPASPRHGGGHRLRSARGRRADGRSDQHHLLPRPHPAPAHAAGTDVPGLRAQALLLLQLVRVGSDRRAACGLREVARLHRRLRGRGRSLARHARRLRLPRLLPTGLRLRLP